MIRNGLLATAALLAIVWGGLALSGSAYALIPGLAAAVALCGALVAAERRWGTIATAGLGLGCSVYLYQQKLAGSAAGAACSIDAVIDCGKVNSSAWSEFQGVPITLFGAAYYLALALAGLLGRRGSADRGHFDQLNAVLAVGAVAYSAVLGWASAQLGAVCVVCITMYAANVVLLVAGLAGIKEHQRTLLGGLGDLATSREARTLVLVGGLTLAAGYGGAPKSGAPRPAPRTSTGQIAWGTLYAAASHCPERAADEPTAGGRDARYHLTEYADFGCGHCARAKKELDELLKIRRDVSLTFKPFPLSGLCNPALPDDGGGKERCDAALAAVCAHAQGRFWPMAELLFENQGYFQPDQLRKMAEQAGVAPSAYDACMSDPASLERLRVTGSQGGKLDIHGTPAIYLEGAFGERCVEITGGVPAVLEILEALDRGEKLPPPSAGH